MRSTLRSIFSGNRTAPLIFLSLMAAIIPAVSTAYQLTRSFVEVRARVTGSARAQLFNDCGAGFSGTEYSALDVPAAAGPQVLRFEISRRSRSFLFRLIGPRGRAEIASVAIIGNGANDGVIIPAADIRPLGRAEAPGIALDKTNIDLATAAPGSLFLILPAAALHLQPGLKAMAPPVLKSLLLSFLCALAFFFLAFKLYRPVIFPLAAALAGLPPLKFFGGRRRAALLLGLGIFCAVVGTRLWMIDNFGSSLPCGDQWDAEAVTLYKPYFEGTLTLPALFAPHNEHRIFFTRALALGLLELSGRWDAKLQMKANAVLFAGVACGLLLLYAGALRGRRLAAAGAFIALVFAVPFGWQNTLWGFQSQFYFLIGFSAAAIWLLEAHPPLTLKWALGCFFGVCCLFTMASGLLAAAAVVCVLALRAARLGAGWKEFLLRRWPTLAVCACLLIAGLLLKPVVADNSALQARSAADFLSALATCLAWPNPLAAGWALVNWLPFAALSAAFALNFTADDRVTRFTLGLGALVLLQSAATAYVRGAGILTPASRYMDLLSLGLLVNFCSLLILWPGPAPSARPTSALAAAARRAASLVPALTLWLWLPVNFAGLCLLSDFSVARQMPLMKDSQRAQRANVAAFLETDDISHLKDKPFMDIPYTDADKLASILREPAIRRLLAR